MHSYFGLELDNNLTALLVNTKDHNICAAALTVDVGYMDDPVDVPGMAHFTEHMLFMSTEKYPVEGDI